MVTQDKIPPRYKPPTCEKKLKNSLYTGMVVRNFNSSILKIQACGSLKLKARLVYRLIYRRAKFRK